MLVPWAIPTVVSSKMFGWLFDGQNGLVNHVLIGLGIIQSRNMGWYSSIPTRALAHHRHRRRLEDHAVHGPAAPGGAADDPAFA